MKEIVNITVKNTISKMVGLGEAIVQSCSNLCIEFLKNHEKDLFTYFGTLDDKYLLRKTINEKQIKRKAMDDKHKRLRKRSQYEKAKRVALKNKYKKK